MQSLFVVTQPLPKSPFTNWPIQHFDDRFGFAWFAEPAVFVSHLTITQGDAAAAEGINDALDHVIATRAEEIRAANGLLVIQDFRSVRAYTSEARQTFLERLKQRPRGYSRGVFVAVGINPLLRMAIQTANMAFSMFIGGAVELVPDPAPILEENCVQTPGRRPLFT